MTEWTSHATASLTLAFHSKTGWPAANNVPRAGRRLNRPGAPRNWLGHGGAAWRRLSGLACRIAEWQGRRAVMEGLYGMSDRELADIALTRSNIPHIFDPEFARAQARLAADERH